MPSNRDVQPHPDRMSSSGLANIIYGTVVLALSLVCVALRFLHRMRTNNLWWDDWTILAGLFTGIGVYVCLVLDALPSGGASGYHTDTYTLAGLYVWGRISLAMGAIYIVSIAFSRVSVLLFYRRIFSVDAVFLRFVRIVAALVVAICVTYFFGAIFQDRARVLNTDITKPYTSVNAGIFFFFTGLVNILLDVAIVALVQHRLWRLHMGWRRKLGLSALLLVVVLSIIAGVLRLMYLARSSRTDLTYTFTPVLRWEAIESHLYIICASLPLVYNFFRINRSTHRSSHAHQHHNNNNTSAAAAAGRDSRATITDPSGRRLHRLSSYTSDSRRTWPSISSSCSAAKTTAHSLSTATSATLPSQVQQDCHEMDYTSHNSVKAVNHVNYCHAHHRHRPPCRVALTADTADNEDCNGVPESHLTTLRQALLMDQAEYRNNNHTTTTTTATIINNNNNNNNRNYDSGVSHLPIHSHHHSVGKSPQIAEDYDLQPLDQAHIISKRPR